MCPRALARSVAALALGLAGCVTVPKDAHRLQPDSMKKRQLQTRRFDGIGEADVLAASAGVLQDLGFNLEESETRLGLIVASKERSAVAATGLPLDWRKMNPVAMIAMDEFLLWVNSETPYKTAKQFLDAVKAAPADTFKMGGTGSKREDHLITFALEKVYGTKFTYIPYKSGGEAATQPVGKHTDSNVNNPSENIAQWRAGQVRALCVFSDQRMVYTEKITKDQSWADIPTCKGSGVNVTYQMLRAFFLPTGTTPDQAAYYVNVLRKVVETPEWKEYVARNTLKETFQTGADFTKFLEKDDAYHRTLMSEAGFMKK